MNMKTYNISRLRQFRINKGITQTYMAEQLGYKSPSGYSNIENGKRSLSFKTALRISEIIGVEINVLFFD